MKKINPTLSQAPVVIPYSNTPLQPIIDEDTFFSGPTAPMAPGSQFRSPIYLPPQTMGKKKKNKSRKGKKK